MYNVSIKTKKNTNKYKNKKVEIDGIIFDSKRESERYIYLLNEQKKGNIKELKTQVKFELIPKIEHEEVIQLKTKTKTKKVCDQLPITYTCDFTYLNKENELVVEDVKISKYLIPKEFVIKSKLFFWKYGIKIKLVFKSNEKI